MAYRLFTDAAFRPSKKVAGGACIITDETGALIEAYGWPMPPSTSNQGEYQALIIGMLVASIKGIKDLHVHMDSQLVIEQVVNSYKVKSPNLKPLHEAVLFMIELFDGVKFTHIPREQNKEADRLAGKSAMSGDTFSLVKIEELNEISV